MQLTFKNIGILFFIQILLISGSCEKDNAVSTDLPENSIISIPNSTGEIVHHAYFSLAYNESHEQAEWVFYKLTSMMLAGDAKRTDDFRIDAKISTGSADLNDYKGSGFDRGHLCPAADMVVSEIAMSESFLLSNISPQNPSFNRGIWSSLESIVRANALIEDSIYLATGPIFKNINTSIGTNEVSVPGFYYKVIYAPGNQKMIAFILPNEKGTAPVSNFVVTVDSVERVTGIDFFPLLQKELQAQLESISDTGKWTMLP